MQLAIEYFRCNPVGPCGSRYINFHPLDDFTPKTKLLIEETD